MGTCTAFVFAALVEFTFVNYTWRTRGKLPGIPTGLETQENLLNTNSNGENHQNKNLLNLEMVSSCSYIFKVQHNLNEASIGMHII